MNEEKLSPLDAFRLTKKSAAARSSEKINEALLWVYRFGFSTPQIVDFMWSPNRSGFAKSLVDRGFMEISMPDTKILDKGIPRKFLTLTPDGLARATMLLEDDLDLLPYKTNKPERMVGNNALHDFLIQRTIARALKNGAITGYKTERQLRAKSTVARKVFDALMITPSASNQGLELELSPKSGRDLDHFCTSIASSIEQQAVDIVLVGSPSRALLKKYKMAMEREAVHIWIQDQVKKVYMETEKTIPVKSITEGKIVWKQISWLD